VLSQGIIKLFSLHFKKVVIARSEATFLHAEVALRLPARSRSRLPKNLFGEQVGEGRARRRGNPMRLLHFVRNDTLLMSTYLGRSL